MPVHADAIPCPNPLPSGAEHSSNSAVDGAGLAHHLDVPVLDQVQSWGWDDMLFVECGDGRAAEEAWRRRRARGHVVALDMSPRAIERARLLRGVTGWVEFATWDGRRLCQANDIFDQLICSFALQHSPDPEAHAREMLRVLRPRGELYALEPESNVGEARRLLAWAGFSEIAEVARGRSELDGGVGLASAVVIHARVRAFL
jgi:SAM-dependent methyltransferase